MTQKELLYVEDAVEHEKSIIKICEESIVKLNNPDFKAFFEQEISKHQNICEKLMALLRGKVNG